MMGTRENAAAQDFSGIPLEEEEESHLKDAAVISMGTEISLEDMMNIEALCDQVMPCICSAFHVASALAKLSTFDFMPGAPHGCFPHDINQLHILQWHNSPLHPHSKNMLF